jgi:hypothetical protein
MLTTLFLTLILIAPPADADRQFRRVSVYDGHVTLEVPAEWEEIPPELLESHSLQMAESTGGRLTEVYQHGFRSNDPEVDFVLPECLVQIRESGRLRYRQFLELPSIEEMRPVAEEALADRSGTAVREMELRDAVFDHDTFSLHLRNTLELGYESKTTVESVAFLTERGLFTIHFYARTAQIDAMSPVYARIINSVRFDEELRYQPRLTDRLPSRLPVILLACAALIAIGATAAHLSRRRRRQP